MPSSSAATTALTVLTILSSIALRLSPLPDYYWVHRHKTTGEVALLPVVALFVNSGAVGLYAYMIGNFVPLLATNAFGVCMALLFIGVFFLHTSDRVYVYKLCGVGLASFTLVLLYMILADTGATHQSRSQAGTTLGWITMLTSVAQFGSPLATVKRVVETKSSASLPFAMCLMNVINGSLWVAYSSVDWNAFVLAPNIFSVALGIAQVTLWVIYQPSRSDKMVKTSAGLLSANEEGGGSVVIEMSRSQSNTLERIPSCVSTGSSAFVELTSPSTPWNAIATSH